MTYLYSPECVEGEFRELRPKGFSELRVAPVL